MSARDDITNITRANAVGLGLIGTLILASGFVMIRFMQDSALDATLISVAGRQRTMSQTIVKDVLLTLHGDEEQIDHARDDLDRVLTPWARSHLALRQGDPEAGLTGKNPPEIALLLTQLDADFQVVLALAERFVDEGLEVHRALAYRQGILSAASTYLSRMDQIVDLFEGEALARSQRLYHAQMAFAVSALALLVGVGLLIFRPVVRRVAGEMKRREQAELRLSHQAEELRDAVAKANTAVEAKSRFLAAMSHEMRTPLNGILGMGQVLESTALDGEQCDSLRVINSSSRALLTLVNDILDHAKLEAGQIEFEALDFAVADLVEDSLGVVRPEARRKGLSCEVHIADSLPSHLNGDARCLRQVLLNLLSNAIKFTPEGTVSVRVEGRPGRGPHSHRTRFEIRDSGIGIPVEARDRLFRPFSQVDASTTRRFGGTGLGLAISRGLVVQMGGELDYESVVGEGTTFWFEVELAVAAKPLATEQHPRKEGASRRALEVLVVDDVEVNRMVAKKLLQLIGHRATAAESGAAAIELVRARRFDVVLMDIQMPNMDGLEATAALRALEEWTPGTPVVALTADAMTGDREHFLECGMDDYLAKPIDRSELAACLDRFSGTLDDLRHPEVVEPGL